MTENTMRPWMRLGQFFENVLADPKRVLDAWEAGGVRGLVLGRMVFRNAAGNGSVAAFAPQRQIYRQLDVEPPPPPEEEHPDKRRQLDALLDDARGRGWRVWIFEAAYGRGPGGDGPLMLDDRAQRAYAARVADTLAAFPQAEGAVMDGPEWGYEIDPDHRSYLFSEPSPQLAVAMRSRGLDPDRLAGANQRFYHRLHTLTPSLVRAHASGGVLGGMLLFDLAPELVAWWRFRQEALTAFVAGTRERVTSVCGGAKLGMGPRTPAFAPLAGYDLPALAKHLDLLLPKHYFWHRGFDGLYGTVDRYVSMLCEWNPELRETDALAVVRCLFGLELPGMTSGSDLENGFPPEFFTETVHAETARALAVMGDPERVLPWVDVGRRPHAGDPMSAGDLRRILLSSQAAGLTQFLYHNHVHLTPGEWTVLSEMCGTRWRPSPDGYSPPDDEHRMP